MLSQLPVFGIVVGWCSPDDLDIASNALFPRVVVPKALKVVKLRATVETAPTGADIEIDVYLGTITTGALDGSPIGQIVIAAGAFYGELILSVPADWPITKFAVPDISQVGSGTPGATVSITAECQLTQ